MPEGPELRRSRDHLQRYVGHTIVAVTVLSGRYTTENLVGYGEWVRDRTPINDSVLGVDVKGKFMWWSLQDDWHLWCTYGMSGQWSSQPTQHCALFLDIRSSTGTNGRLAFNDARHFGTLKFVKGRAALDKKLRSLGPDMLNDPSPDEATFRQALLRKHDQTLAEVMMNQSVVSGIGNYVKAEALYLAELSPHRTVRDLTTQEIERLRVQVINVMKASYNSGGATIRSYANVDGTKGGAQRRFAVYGNKLDPMGNPVTKEETLDGRTTWWVPEIQR